MSLLIKQIVPGTPGSPGSPGSPGYCVTYDTTTTTCETYIDTGGAGGAAGVGTDCTTTVAGETVCYPATDGTSPTPPTPDDFNLGWNSGAYSIGTLTADGQATWSVKADSIGVVVGLFTGTPTEYVMQEVQYGFLFSAAGGSGYYSVIEQGSEKTSALTYVTADVFAVTRVGTEVRYFKNGELIYTSQTDSYGTVTLEASLYAAFDTVIDAALTATISSDYLGYGASDTSFLPLGSTGGEADYADGEASFEALTVTSTGTMQDGGTSTFEPMESYGAKTTYAIGNAEFAEMTATGAANSFVPNLALSYNAFPSLQNFGLSTTTGASLIYDQSLGDNTRYWTAGQWVGYTVTITSGPGVGESQVITANTIQALLFNTSWTVTPTSASTYQISLDGTVYAVGTVTPDNNTFVQLASLSSDYVYAGGDASFQALTSKAEQGVALNAYAILVHGGGYSVVASGSEASLAGVDATLPTPTLEAYGGATLNATLPMLTASISGTVTVVGRVDATLPMGLLDASGTTGGLAGVEATVTGGYEFIAYSGATAVLALSPFGYTVTASGLVGGIGYVYATISGIYSLTSEITTEATGQVDATLPMLQVVPSGQAWLVGPRMSLHAVGTEVVSVEYEAYAINLKTGAVTHYTNYPFDNLIRLGNQFFGVAASGLYLIGGDLDLTLPIDAHIKTFETTFGSRNIKRLPYVYTSGRSDGGVIIGVTADEGTTYEYESDWGEVPGNTNHRTKVGKGIKGVYYSLDVKNVDGGSLELDQIIAHITPSERAI